jgi:hypothetical protein
MKSMCCLCIQFTRENTSDGTILHLVKKQDPLSKVWLLALQKRLATPLGDIRGADNVTADASGLVTGFLFSSPYSDICTDFKEDIVCKVG